MLMVGVDDLKYLLQPKGFCDFVVHFGKTILATYVVRAGRKG